MGTLHPTVKLTETDYVPSSHYTFKIWIRSSLGRRRRQSDLREGGGTHGWTHSDDVLLFRAPLFRVDEIGRVGLVVYTLVRVGSFRLGPGLVF